MVVQSSTSETFSEGAEALSGRPIYTVYLQVGAPREWILQYCVPNMAGPVQTGGLVTLGNPEPVGAPYPMVTVRPPEDWRHGRDYLLVHGFLDESGRFRDMTILASRTPHILPSMRCFNTLDTGNSVRRCWTGARSRLK